MFTTLGGLTVSEQEIQLIEYISQQVPRSLQRDELPPLLRAAETEPRYAEPAVGRQPLLGRQHRQRRHHAHCGRGAVI